MGRNALISVFNKDGIESFAADLILLGFTIYGSDGTCRCLKAAGLLHNVHNVAELVGGGPILGHRVVTLSREIHAGLLAKNTPEDNAELASLNIPRFDLVCVDMYPLEAEIARQGSDLESVIEKTDIGGPTMIRSAVKGRRIVICDSADRQRVIDWLKAGEPGNGFVGELCAKAEYTVAQYVMASSRYLSDGKYVGFFGERIATCKYGENAWQTPSRVYSNGSYDAFAMDKFSVVEGTPPSYNNWVDIDRLLQTITHIAAAQEINFGVVNKIAVGVKHGNACGASQGIDSGLVSKNTMAGDLMAIFGGLVMTNFAVDSVAAENFAVEKLDGIIAPSFSNEAIARLRRKGDKCRFVVNLALADLGIKCLDRAPRFRYVRGGFITQPNYLFVPNFSDERIQKYGRAVGNQEADMLLAWAIGSTSNSNTITIVNDGDLLGNGVGQQIRVGAADLGIRRSRNSGHSVEGAVAYSDSFFPFPDGPKKLIDAGIAAIFTTSESRNDQQTIDLCLKNHVTLYMIPDAIGRGFYGH